jgi:hypothetical protein
MNSTKLESKGFFISDEDLKLFEEWIKKPGSVKEILEAHSEKMKTAQPFFDRLNKMTTITAELAHTPFVPIL